MICGLVGDPVSISGGRGPFSWPPISTHPSQPGSPGADPIGSSPGGPIGFIAPPGGRCGLFVEGLNVKPATGSLGGLVVGFMGPGGSLLARAPVGNGS